MNLTAVVNVSPLISVFAMMFTLPALLPVTTPVSGSTTAMFLSELSNVTTASEIIFPLISRTSEVTVALSPIPTLFAPPRTICVDVFVSVRLSIYV